MPLDVDDANRAVEALGTSFGTGAEATAHGILSIANASIVNLLRLVSVRRGRDPREFAIIACGGGGPVHAPFVARELRIPEIVVPRAPGHFSALGMLMSDVRHDLVRTAILAADEESSEGVVAAIWEELDRRMLETFRAEGFPERQVRLVRAIDLRYRGQEHTVTVTAPDAGYAGAVRAEIRRRFDEAHERLYTFRLDIPAELVNFRLTGWGAVSKPSLDEIPDNPDPHGAITGSRRVDLDIDLGAEATVYDRSVLGAGAVIEGPAVIEEAATSTLVLPGMDCTVDLFGNLIVRTNA